MNGTYDAEADAVYLRLVDPPVPGSSQRQPAVEVAGLPTTVVFDLDDEDRILGIEFIGARAAFRSETLAALQRLG